MIDITGSIFVYTTAVDMRKSIDGLAMLVTQFSLSSPQCQANTNSDTIATSAFVFINSARDKIKMLVKENNGYCLIYKRLDRGCFKLTFTKDGYVTLTKQQLRWVLDGLDYTTLKPLTSPSYSLTF
jgi:transposase